MTYYLHSLFLYFLLIATIFINPMKLDAQSSRATEVIATKVSKQPFMDEVEALGTLKAYESIEVTSAVTEVVTEINFTDGQRVKKGDILIKMDQDEEQAVLEEERFTYEEAQLQLKRIRSLVKKQAASESSLDEQERIAKTAKARMNAIQARINLRIVKAPFSGIVGLRNISVGALLQPGSMITTLDDDHQMRLDFTVPALFLETLKEGLVIEARTRAFPDKIFTGTLTSIDSRIDPVARSITARAIIDNANLELKPGLLMRVNLKKRQRQALVVPEEAIITNGNLYSVFVLTQSGDDTKVEQRTITLGGRRKGIVEVLSGLKSEEMIVAHGISKVRPGGNAKILKVIEEGQPISTILKGHDAS